MTTNQLLRRRAHHEADRLLLPNIPPLKVAPESRDQGQQAFVAEVMILSFRVAHDAQRASIDDSLRSLATTCHDPLTFARSAHCVDSVSTLACDASHVMVLWLTSVKNNSRISGGIGMWAAQMFQHTEPLNTCRRRWHGSSQLGDGWCLSCGFPLKLIHVFVVAPHNWSLAV